VNARPLSAADLRSRVLDAVRREPTAARPSETRRRAILVALGFAAAGSLALIKLALDHTTSSGPGRTGAGRRLWHVVVEGGAPAQARPLGYVLTLELVWLLVAAGATWAGITRGRTMLGRSGASKLAVAALTPVALTLTWLIVALAWLQSILPLAWLEAMDDAPDLQFHANCALMSVVYAVGPLLAFFAMRRSRDPVSPRQSGAAIGAVAGAWGAVLHFPFCPCTSPLHMALGHVFPAVLLAAIGAIAGDRALGVHPSTA
jgi:Negative regulator of sigma F